MPALAGLSRSTLMTPAGGSPPLECDTQNTWVRKNPRAWTQVRPPVTSTPQSRPVPPLEGSEGEVKAPEGGPGGQTSKSESRHSGQGRPYNRLLLTTVVGLGKPGPTRHCTPHPPSP